MSMQRTIKLQLEPTREQADALLETLRQHTECFNAVCAYGWMHAEKNGVRLHHQTTRRREPRALALGRSRRPPFKLTFPSPCAILYT